MTDVSKVCTNKMPDGSCRFKKSKDICLHWNKRGKCRAPNLQKEIIHKSNDPMELGLVTIAIEQGAKYHIIQLARTAQEFLDVYWDVTINNYGHLQQKEHLQNLINKSLEWAQE